MFNLEFAIIIKVLVIKNRDYSETSNNDYKFTN